MPTEIAGEQIYTLKEVAAGLGVHYQTVKAWVADGKINARKIGKSYRVTGAELDRLLKGEPADSEKAQG
jgi:excisionase family DNA binding protein